VSLAINLAKLWIYCLGDSLTLKGAGFAVTPKLKELVQLIRVRLTLW